METNNTNGAIAVAGLAVVGAFALVGGAAVGCKKIISKVKAAKEAPIEENHDDEINFREVTEEPVEA